MNRNSGHFFGFLELWQVIGRGLFGALIFGIFDVLILWLSKEIFRLRY